MPPPLLALGSLSVSFDHAARARGSGEVAWGGPSPAALTAGQPD